MHYEVTQIKQTRRHRIIPKYKWRIKLRFSDTMWHWTTIKCFGLKAYCHSYGTKQNHENEEIGRQQENA